MSESRAIDAFTVPGHGKKLPTLRSSFRSVDDRDECEARKFRETFANAAIGLAHVSLDGHWTRVNAALCEILGYTEAELIKKTFREVTYSEDLDSDVALSTRLMSGAIPFYVLEKRYVRKDGSLVWIRLHGTLVRDPDGRPDYFVAVVENIEERKQAESALALSERRHNIVLSAARVGVFDFFGTEDHRNYRSFWVRRHFGIDESSPLSFKRFINLIHPEDRRAVECNFHRCISKPNSRYHIEYRVVREDDQSIRWIEANGQSFFDETEQAIRLCGTTVDITARKVAELALKVSESRFRIAFDNIPDVVVIYDQNLRIRYINSATTRITGLPPEAYIGKQEDEVFPPELIAPWQPALRAALEEGRTSSIDVKLPLKNGFRYCRITCVPLPDEHGRIIEVMGITHDFTEQQNAREQVRRASLHDPLTGLPNRALLFEYSAHVFNPACAQHQHGAVLYVDLDGFKQVNDLHGHAAGDQLLVEAATRIQKVIRAGDLLFRLGSDEFVVLLPEISDDSDSAQMAEQLINALSAPYCMASFSLLVSASVGISLFPADGTDIGQLVQASDNAMHMAKQNGKNTWRFFSLALSRAMRKTIELQSGIRCALEKNELEVLYQPVLDIATGKYGTAEALLRWPKSGVGPEKFIPAAESAGQITMIGEWVIEEACRTHRQWLDDGLSAIPIAVNVSALQLRDRSFRRKVLNLLKKFGLPPSALQLELTESAMLEDIAMAISVLQQLRADHIRLSLDDFGIGYSSLAHLARLPIDKIKIDKSFVQSIESCEGSRAVTEAIATIARRLKLEIVAEGVENQATARSIISLGCHQIQGYLISAPVSADELTRMISYPPRPLTLKSGYRSTVLG